MNTPASTIDEALAMLKKSATTEVIEEEVEEEVSAEVEAEVDADEAQKGDIKVDMAKAEDTATGGTAELIQADGFMEHLAKNQDINTAQIVKGLEGNMNATASFGVLVKGLMDELKENNELLRRALGQPQPRKSSMTKAEATESMQPTPKGPESAPRQLTKGDIIRALEQAKQDDPMLGNDILKAESAFASEGPTVLSELLYSFSPKAKAIVQTLLGN